LKEAPVERRPAEPRPEHEYFVFRVGGVVMGVRSEHVREVTRVGMVTPLPKAPAFVLGVVGHRGEVFPLLDLLRFLGQGDSRPPARTRLFVSSVHGSVVGFVVEDVEGLKRVAAADTLPKPAGPGPGLEYVEGVSHARELGAVTLLDLAGIVAAARRMLVSR
jgi:purine-binding chemotaxis protein CheW